jgi:hypothetical protein
MARFSRQIFTIQNQTKHLILGWFNGLLKMSYKCNYSDKSQLFKVNFHYLKSDCNILLVMFFLTNDLALSTLIAKNAPKLRW